MCQLLLAVTLIRCYPDWWPTIESKTRKVLASLFSQFSQASGPDDDCHTPIPFPTGGIQLRPQNITYIHTLPSKISEGDSGFGKQEEDLVQQPFP